MRLVVLYGLPGSGKLTIAKELIRQLGNEYKLFHNQMTVDIIAPIIPFPHPKGFELSGKYRKLMIETCSELGINLIHTLVFASKDRESDRDDSDMEFIQFMINSVEQHGGKVHFVHLQCDRETVFQRIQNEDRKAHRKVRDPAKLKPSLERWDLESPIPGVENLTIDTVKYQPEESARIIIEHYDL